MTGKKRVDSGQNGQHNKDIKGRNPAPATEGKEMDGMALCPTRAKVASAMKETKRVTVEWKPTASNVMRATVTPYGRGWTVTWSVGVALEKGGRPATGTDAAATLVVTVAFDAEEGRWQAKLTPGQDEGESPLTLEGKEGGYQSAQAAIAGAMAEYARTIGKRRGYTPTALRATTGGGDLFRLTQDSPAANPKVTPSAK